MPSLKFREIICLVYSGLLFLSGLLLISLSAYLLFKLFYHFTFVPSVTVEPLFVILGLGVAHLFLTWVGIKGPRKEHNFHIIMFVVFTFALFCCEFAIGVWSMILWDEIEIECIELMMKEFDEFVKLNMNKKSWYKLQTKLQCCGVSGSNDYLELSDNYPTSCFSQATGNDTVVFKEGCKRPLINYVKGVLVDGAILSFFNCVLQAVGIFVFFTFFKALRAERAERARRASTLATPTGPSQTPSATPHSSPPYPVAPPARAAT